REAGRRPSAAAPAAGVARRTPGRCRARTARTAAAAARACRAARPCREADQHPEPALAMGIVQPRRTHLSELATGDHAGVGEGLRPDPRADAPQAHGSLGGILEAGCR